MGWADGSFLWCTPASHPPPFNSVVASQSHRGMNDLAYDEPHQLSIYLPEMTGGRKMQKPICRLPVGTVCV